MEIRNAILNYFKFPLLYNNFVKLIIYKLTLLAKLGFKGSYNLCNN